MNTVVIPQIATDDELSYRFLEGLKKYNLKLEEIKNPEKWKPRGGSQGPGKRYFEQCFPDWELPEQQDHCVCGHAIKDNRYLYNEETDRFLVLGNCCIKRFLPQTGTRRCQDCNEPHKRRTGNLCKDCEGVRQTMIDNDRRGVGYNSDA